jgi:hypothetical protein
MLYPILHNPESSSRDKNLHLKSKYRRTDHASPERVGGLAAEPGHLPWTRAWLWAGDLPNKCVPYQLHVTNSQGDGRSPPTLLNPSTDSSYTHKKRNKFSGVWRDLNRDRAAADVFSLETTTLLCLQTPALYLTKNTNLQGRYTLLP